MSTYTIAAVNDGVRTWNTQKGAEMKSYRVTLRNKDNRELGNVEVSRVASAPPPAIGESIEGEVDKSGQYGPKFKADRPGGGGGFRGKTAEERRSIAMQHAQKCAVTILEVAAGHGDYKPPERLNEMAEHVELLASSLFKQVTRAEAGA